MALKKEIKFKNGVTMNYHRLDNIKVDNKNKSINCDVISYCDESYRNQEIDNKTSKERHEELFQLIQEENKKEESERNTEKVIKWSDEMAELFDKFDFENIDLSVAKTSYKFNEVTDFSMGNLYDLLKKEEMFIDSEDV